MRNSTVVIVMSIKSEPATKNASQGECAYGVPRSSDPLSVALQRAFETPDDELGDLSGLLKQLDAVETYSPRA